ncbi:ABC transporter ATP-binding protein [Microgenomates group bacterium]|nr:ABC transporter ATP-binding protein [Microgenomates group bacterium]
MLEVKNVEKSFGAVRAVGELSFKVKPGQIVGLLGPNGAGKTTTMRLVASYFFPDSGEINIDGETTTESTLNTQGKIGYLPENNPLYTEMLVMDYLLMMLELNTPEELASLDKTERWLYIYEQARAVNLEKKLGLAIGSLSKGYRQRVGLAAALLAQPKLLILDEPTEGLDPNERQEIRTLIKKLSKERMILISTHVLQEVKALCNRAIVINEGKVVVEGDPTKLTGKYLFELEIEGAGVETKIKTLLKKGDKITWVDKKAKVKKLQITAEKDIRPALNKLAAGNKWQIWSMSMADELDQVFSDLK